MNVVITGTSKGIGNALCKTFAQAGHTVYAISRTKSVEYDYENIISINGNIVTDLPNVISQILKYTHTIDLLINNAAILINKPFLENTKQDALDVFDTNVFSSYFLIQALIKNNLLKPNSAIYNLSSMGGFQGSAKFAGLSLYSISKGALCTLTEVLAEELKSLNISCNAFALGAVDTEMLQAAFPDFKSATSAKTMADFIFNFCMQNNKLVNGKIIPISFNNP